MAKFTSICLALALSGIPVAGNGATYTNQLNEGQFELRPPGYDSHLFKGWQNRLIWHLMNEGRYALKTTGLFTATSLALDAIEFTDSSATALMVAAYITHDWARSQNWLDFALRQTSRVPWIAWQVGGGKAIPSWAIPLIVESPILLMGAWETFLQLRGQPPKGVKAVHLAPSHGPVSILFKNTEIPEFILQFPAQEQGLCNTLEPVTSTSSYQLHLTHLSCTAWNNAIQQFTVQPVGSPSKAERALKIEVTRKNGETVTQEIAVIDTDHKQHQGKPWITDILPQIPHQNSIGQALSPLAENALSVFSKILAEEHGSQAPSIQAEDLTVNVASGKSMLATGLGRTAYVLADHTDTQGLALPELWLGTDLPASGCQTFVALQKLEDKRVPGPEYGPWRLLSAARAIVHNFLSGAVIDFWIDFWEKRSSDSYLGLETTNMSASHEYRQTTTSYERSKTPRSKSSEVDMPDSRMSKKTLLDTDLEEYVVNW